MQASSPPLYQDSDVPESSDLGSNSVPHQSDLPAYTRHPTQPTTRIQREPAEFTTELTNRKGKPWASFTVLSNPALSKKMPIFMEGENITGTVKLSLESGDAIQAVTMSVTGRLIEGGSSGDSYIILDHSLPLWSKSMGDPRTPSSEGKYSGKLQGEYTWPFSFTLPKEVPLPVGPHNSIQVFRLPQTFLERHARSSIQYELSLHLSRSKLRMGDKLGITFGYIPITTPGPPSLLRQLAYQENSPLLGPEADPEGWHILEAVRIRGTVFGDRPVDAKCVLSLAKPLCYTRGSVIPCALNIESQDLQALDLLSSPRAIVVRLRRLVKYHEDLRHSVDSATWRDDIDHSESAFWWASTEGTTETETYTRHLNGEIHLLKDLKPSTAIAHFRIDYSVVLFPFDASAFTSADTEPLLVHPVEIATSYSPGSRPRAHSPPSYESPVQSGNDYRVFLPLGFL